MKEHAVEICKHPMGPVPKWGLYFYWGRGITRVVFNRPLYPAHVDASDSEFQKLLLLVSGLVLSWRAFPQRMLCHAKSQFGLATQMGVCACYTTRSLTGGIGGF